MNKNREKENRRLKDSEAKLWELAVSDIKTHSEQKINMQQETFLDKPDTSLKKKKSNIFMNEPSVKKNMGSQSEYLTVGKPISLDRRTAIRLRRGQIKIEGRLDLHGYNQVEAIKILKKFIQQSSESNKRFVLVITGKGSVGDSRGVLRRELPNWINHEDIRHQILAIEQAQPFDGGFGAFYLLLRRRRT